MSNVDCENVFGIHQIFSEKSQYPRILLKMLPGGSDDTTAANAMLVVKKNDPHVLNYHPCGESVFHNPRQNCNFAEGPFFPTTYCRA